MGSLVTSVRLCDASLHSGQDMCDMCEDPWFERDRDFTLVVGDFRSPDKCDTWVVLLLLVGVQQLRSAFQFSMIASAD